MNELTLHDFDFSLPEALIAQHPAPERSASRLLRVEATGVSDLCFVDLPHLLNPGDLLVMNDTKVIKARFFGQKDTSGQVEVLLERILDARHALAQIRAGKAPKAGCRLDLAGAFSVRVTGRQECFFLLALEDEKEDFWSLAEAHGRLPLPPYIGHAPATEDEARYQTIYARAPGAVAAPTAGLHFDADVLARIAFRGIRTACLTLHVGAGTYQPVRVTRICEHKMHKEFFVLPQETAAAIRQTRAAGGRVVAVGTTTLRALESAACEQGEARAGCGETDIFITPGFDFQVVDCLITNFHLPRSTLLMLVSAFAGIERIRAAYAHAIEQRYRFFSYGDAMLLTRAKAG
ncbi:MAG: tRNA preQ1(34) S-adenosylmethionine ribosyltransferase-isomerase QueA [Zoogloeaceae bacterium]|nr:tRNA preQ1(34) S-adenosylmethionine ribosyltransferase-isomerase QueA [Zoogloeaceae bacterium]